MGETDDNAQTQPAQRQADDLTHPEAIEAPEQQWIVAEQEPTAQPQEPTVAELPDDLAEAVSAAEEKVESPDSLDNIEPVTTAVPEVAEVLAEPPAKAFDSSVPWWPFLAYLGAWIVLAAAAVWRLLQLPATQVAYESQAYALTVLGGLIMTAVGPLLIVTVWITEWARRPKSQRAGLLTSALLKGALVTLTGAIIWWAALIIVDYLRLGHPL